ncbi:endonuclease/exonuclease/phosphatase family protein [Zhihengliuella flava]|uniref:Endonuclease/exonuclease/phosphatase family metal-dependent hydrolase n=1 Tax=Zhihengliuella flava TaxID=1285193 RepID=A0A931DDL1_9MICC|nr:endonuclease/exonuclease/phosphatase family protein [Zhihengliuella flava]MBG6084863.1 endonuclease/exonuclease/phosphatase family metal-dependent hydrolase [Zhihengliuella flava]
MHSLKRALAAVMTSAALAAASVMPAHAAAPASAPASHGTAVLANHDLGTLQTASVTSRAVQTEEPMRIATYNASLFREAPGALIADLSSRNNSQAQAVAEIIQRSAPDVLLVNEFDYDAEQEAATLFRDNYLTVSQNGQKALEYPYIYTAPSNTGVPTGADLNGDGTIGGPDDAFGYGAFEGQYGMVLYSKYPIDVDSVRTFQNFRWADMPGNVMPRDYYGELTSNVLRLSSKSHWDVPIRIGDRTVHVLAAHPTPPSFDGEEQRNARRNHDEIRFLADYVAGGETASYIYDDAGAAGGLADGEDFVIVGDMNADPQRGDSYDSAIMQLLDSEQITDPQPRARGAIMSNQDVFNSLLGRATNNSSGDNSNALRTADFGGSTGSLRVDYVLPSTSMDVTNSGVFWPAPNQPGAELIQMNPVRSSDHRLVWADVSTGE